MQEVGKVLVSDFDGTITKKDFFHYVIDELLTDADITPWEDYLAGNITHFEALSRIYQKIRIDTEEFHEFINGIQIEDCFLDTVDFCLSNNINIYVVSAGADYYIKHIFEELGIRNNISIISNESTFSPETGLVMNRIGEDSPFYNHNYGIDKERCVQFLKDKYGHVVFAGDGNPDYLAAKQADVVFARAMLLDLCRDNGVQAQELDSYCSVLNYLKSTFYQ